MATALQDQNGKWKIDGLKWDETGLDKPVPSDLSFTGAISYKKEESVSVTISGTPKSYDTTWETPLGVGLVASEIKVKCSDVTKKVDGKWYTYVAVSGFKQSDIEPFEARLSVDCTNTTPGSQATTATLKILCNTVWEASVNVPWITIPATTGRGDFSERISFKANKDTTSRTGVITVTSMDKTETITITQSEFVPEISLMVPETVEAAETSIPYTVTTNVDAVTVKCSNGQTFTELSGTFTIPANERTEPIEYVITATCTNYPTITKIVTVTQKGSEFIPEISLTAPATIEATETSISYTATSNVDDVIVELSDGQRKTDKIGSFTIEENTSSDQVTYTLTAFCTNYPTITKSVTVTQKGNGQLSVSPTSLAYVSTGGVLTLTISNPAGYRWTITGQPEWISLSTTAGTGDANISVTAQANPQTINRDGQLVVNDIDNDKHITVELSQEGGVLPIYCDFEFKYNTAVTVTNMTAPSITFEDTSTQAFKMDVGTANIGTGFDGEADGADAGVAVVTVIGIGSETQGNLNVKRQDEIANVGLSYSFEGNKDESQRVTVNLIFTNKTDPSKGTKTSGDIVDGASPTQINFYDWFNLNGRVDVDVSFEIKVRYPN